MMLLSPGCLWLPLFFGFYLLFLRRRGMVCCFTPRARWLLAAMLLAVGALSRPVLPEKPREVSYEGSDIIFAVDLSRSMQATDIAPSRLEAAKALLAQVVKADTRNRFGVIAFTTNAIILSPLTRDSELLLHLFSGLDTSLVMSRGTRIGGALELSRRLSKAPNPIVVLLTDGGDERGYDREAAAARRAGLIIDVVMLATASGATLRDARGVMLRDASGGIVVTARNSAIGTLAAQTGGAVIDGADAGALARAIASQDSRKVKGKSRVAVYRELFPYLLGAALICAMLGMTTLGRRRQRGTDA